MTYILGSHCSNGVVLVADRKITFDDNTVEYENKLFMPYTPIVLGSSGSTVLYDKFRQESFLAAQKYKGNIQWLPYLEDIEDVTKRLNKRYASQKLEFEVLVAVQTKDVGAQLQHILPAGYGDRVKKYRVIGSGEPYGSIFLKKHWRREMVMQDVAELGYFIIRNIEENILDGKVGLGKSRHPQIYYIPSDKESNVREASEAELTAIKNKVEEWLSKYNNQIENLFV
jgi:20S proteasome alpha/beta subunit